MNILEKIVNKIKIDLVERKKILSIETLKKKSSLDIKSLSLYDSLNNDYLSLIAEIKDTSPSKGKLMKDKDFLCLAKNYLDANVNAISVVTEKNFFNGSINNINNIKKLNEYNSTPILRKDFIIDEYQIYESKYFNADAILLIASLLDEKTLKDFVNISYDLDLDVLLEIHGEDELSKALNSGVKIIGVNNRNLNNFEVDLNTTSNIVNSIPNYIIKISESGIYTKKDMQKLRDEGCNAVLIGESIITSPNPYNKIIELMNLK